jgi:hypothetical protein
MQFALVENITSEPAPGLNNLWRLVIFDSSTKKGALGPIGREYLIEDLTLGNRLARIV